MKKYNIAIVGATGAVGQTMLKILEERDFPVNRVLPLASARSNGISVSFRGEKLKVLEATPASFNGIDIALFSAGKTVSKELAPEAIKRGAIVIDNSNAFRMSPEVPLVVPEVNPEDIKKHKGIISNPNCSTIQMVVALKPLHDVARIKRVVVSTYQAVSGTGLEAIEELMEQLKMVLNGEDPKARVYPYPIALNVLPHIDVFDDTGYSQEELKMVNETKKIMNDDNLAITATTVRVPVMNGHSEAVNIETEEKLTAEMAREILSKAPGIKVVDDPKSKRYPLPGDVTGRDEVFVGRIREDYSIKNGLNLWIVADNLRKGAALNTIQIAETMVENAIV